MTSPMTCSELISRYCEFNPRLDLQRHYAQVKSAFAKLARASGLNLAEFPAIRLVDNLPLYLAEMQTSMNGAEKQTPNSASRAYKSLVNQVCAWAVANRILPLGVEDAIQLGYPPVSQFIHGADDPIAATCYRAFLRLMVMEHRPAKDLADATMKAFADRLPQCMVNYRSGLKRFSLHWQRNVADGLLPAMDIPILPSRRPAKYRVDFDDLPPVLRQEVEQIRQRMLAKTLSLRNGRKPIRESTVNMRMDHLLQFLGFLVNHQKADLSTAHLKDLLTVDHISDFITYTNDSWLRRHDRVNSPNVPSSYGQYQESLFLSLENIVSFAMDNHQLGDEIKKCRVFSQKEFESRREEAKEIVSLDDWFRIAFKLLQRANLLDITPHQRAILLRNAFMIGLLAQFPYREHILTTIDIGKELLIEGNMPPRLCIRSQDTKTRQRHLVHELPPELHGLLNLYLEVARPLLLGSEKHNALFVSQTGERLSTGGIYRIITECSLDILGIQQNPHLIRKSWETDHCMWSKGGFLIATSILDTGPTTQQQAYLKIQKDHMIDSYDKNASDDWDRADENKTLPKGKLQ